ncbi:MAG TPA: histidine kinase N-terminal domain-containing protein [Streptosporangiaceae bacterium]|nr:histidine kinase N-terminal domain-containing protein [Streptosporangiaceae bacterium]
MPTLTALARQARIAARDVQWLHALVSDWQLLADLSFADLILWARLPDQGWIALAQMRPTTGPTAFPDDIVGSVQRPGVRPFLDAALRDRRICREGDPEWSRGVPVRHETIPVVNDDRVIAVIQRSTNLSSARTPSRLDIAYLKAADDLAQMVTTGLFPYAGDEPALVRSPRVGDGLLRLSRSGKVTYASPNALSAYRRLGLTADLTGQELGPLTARLSASGQPHDDSLMLTASGKAHMETEVDANGSVVQLRTIPLVVHGGRSGALVLLRDVTELRNRERELLTKDATIREIHHRVKNNLQTVAALLRLQARRLSAPEARAALEEAVRRVGSIAIVHETLSHAPEEVVDFDDIAGRVAMMAGEVSAPEVRVSPQLRGKFGMLPAAIATPLALVLTELLQNALQHGLTRPSADGAQSPPGPEVPVVATGTLLLTAERSADRLTVFVVDNGVGLPADFDLDKADSLGLQIVRTLVVAELGGRLEIGPNEGGGTAVQVELPIQPVTTD